jgi:hypothetical protein
MMNLPVSRSPLTLPGTPSLPHLRILELVQKITRFWPGGESPPIVVPRARQNALTARKRAGLLPGRPEATARLQLHHQPLFHHLLS